MGISVVRRASGLAHRVLRDEQKILGDEIDISCRR